MGGIVLITKKDILNQLEDMSHVRGKVVIVHTSIKAIGEIDGGANTLLSALIEYFAYDSGLLLVPTHTWDSTVYDMTKAESCIGVLPKTAAAHPEALRTAHPTHSMAIFGEKKRAEEFAKGEDSVDSPTNPKGCYGKIYDEDGYVLLIGVGQDKNTYLHCVEEMLDVPKRLTEEKVERTVIMKNGEAVKKYIRWFDMNEIPDVSVNFGKFEEAFRYHNCITYGKLGNAKTQLCSARKMKDVLELIYKNAKGRELLADNAPLPLKLYKN